MDLKLFSKEMLKRGILVTNLEAVSESMHKAIRYEAFVFDNPAKFQKVCAPYSFHHQPSTEFFDLEAESFYGVVWESFNKQVTDRFDEIEKIVNKIKYKDMNSSMYASYFSLLRTEDNFRHYALYLKKFRQWYYER